MKKNKKIHSTRIITQVISFFLFRIVPIVLFVIVFTQSLNKLDVGQLSKVTVPVSDEASPHLFLANQTWVTTFVSNEDNLGIVSIRFNTFERINQDTLQFKIKEIDSNEWLSVTEHTVAQFQPGELFPFGFPIQAESKGKKYLIELHSSFGADGNSVALDTKKPAMTLTHKFFKEDLSRNPRILRMIALRTSVALLQQIVREVLTSHYFLLVMSFYVCSFFFYSRAESWIILKIRVTEFEKFSDVVKSALFKVKSTLPQMKKKLSSFFEIDSKRIYPEFDGLRAWAVISVVAAHLVLYFNTILSLDESKLNKDLVQIFRYFPFLGSYGSAMGVNLFFILSSFLIYSSLIKQDKINIFLFMKRRYARLLPAHIAVLIPLLAKSNLSAIVLNIFFLSEFFSHVVNANILTWTMSYEILFYFSCALYVMYRKKIALLRNNFFLPLLYLLLVSTQTSVTLAVADRVKYLDFDYFSAFFFGIVLSQAYHENNKLWQFLEKYGKILTYLSLLFILIYRFMWYDWVFLKVYGQLGLHSIFFLVNLSMFFITSSMLIKNDFFLKVLFRKTALRYVGIVSYSLYLNHMAFGIPIAAYVLSTLKNTTLQVLLLYPMSVFTSFLIAVFLFHYMEKPYFLNRKNGATR